MDDGSSLKAELEECTVDVFQTSTFSIGHRGACLQFPEHSAESYRAAAEMGAGIIECDVTFTKDMELVCRHDQCDLHTTTNILLTPLAEKCTAPFTPAGKNPEKEPATATCCTSDLTLDEFQSLCAKMDSNEPTATTVEEYVYSTPTFRTDLYSTCATLMTHKDYIQLVKSLGSKFTPEAKLPKVDMPYMGTFTQEQFVQKIVDDYKTAGISPRDVWFQSFEDPDIMYLIANEPEFSKQAVMLDDEIDNGVETLGGGDLYKYFSDYFNAGVRIIAPPMSALVKLNEAGDKVLPSDYAVAATAAGLDIITWSFERAEPMEAGGAINYYYSTVSDYMINDGRTLEVLDVIGRDVGVIGIFSDWPATVTYYWNCIIEPMMTRRELSSVASLFKDQGSA